MYSSAAMGLGQHDIAVHQGRHLPQRVHAQVLFTAVLASAEVDGTILVVDALCAEGDSHAPRA